MTRSIRAVALLALAATVAVAAACAKKVDEGNAIRETVIAYVRDVKNLSVDQMNIEFADLKVEGETATVRATFNLKAGGMPPLVYDYKLVKKDGKWNVETSTSAAGMAGHGAGSAAAMPASGMPPGSAAPLDLPPDHPPIGDMMPPATGKPAAPATGGAK